MAPIIPSQDVDLDSALDAQIEATMILRGGKSDLPDFDTDLVFDSRDQALPVDSSQIYFREIAQTRRLTRTETIDLARRVKRGDIGARELFIRVNLPMVISIAKKYVSPGFSIHDLIQEGNIGLIKATEKFDPERGYAFSTYAFWWIKAYILDHKLINRSTFKVSAEDLLLQQRVVREREVLAAQLGPDFTMEILAKHMGVARKKILEVVQDTRAIRALSSSSPILTDGSSDMSLEDTIACPRPLQDTRLVHSTSNEEIRNRARAVLNEREYLFVCMFFGIDGYDAMPIADVAVHMGINSSQAKDLQSYIFRKLRNRLGDEFNPNVV